MKPLITVYWSRFGLGALAGVVAAFVSMFSGAKPGVYELNSFLNGLTVALLVYLASYYILKRVFSTKVEKQSKIMTTGIGIYFFTWLVVWVFLFSVLNGQIIP